jgi:queuine tRNA-ribosyltransferase
MQREGTQVMLSNTFHLMLSPGAETVQRMGGLHPFMRYPGPMLTDSGGYQIFSMGYGSVSDEIKGRRNAKLDPATPSKQSSHTSYKGTASRLSSASSSAAPSTLLGLSEMGASFRSYVDGSEMTLTPEASVDIQRRLGADLIVVLDECTPFHTHPAYTELSMNRSHRWALRSLREFKRGHNGAQALYGIVQVVPSCNISVGVDLALN